MYQHIIMSPLTLGRLRDMPASTRHDLLSHLFSERLLSDSDTAIFKEYEIVVENTSSVAEKQLLQALLPDILTHVLRLPDVKADVRDPTTWKSLQTEIKLALQDKWKIILADTEPEVPPPSTRARSPIEVINLHHYLNPPPHSNVRAEEVITLAPGSSFDFRNWITKYLRGASWLKVTDGYMFEDSALEDVVHIVRQLPRSIPITLEALADRGRGFQKDSYKASERQRTISERTGRQDLTWILHEAKKNCRDRRLETDRFVILLGHILGSVDPKTKRVMKQSIVSVSAIKT